MKLILMISIAALLLAACIVGLRAHEQPTSHAVAPRVQELVCLHYVAVDRRMFAGECRGL